MFPLHSIAEILHAYVYDTELIIRVVFFSGKTYRLATIHPLHKVREDKQTTDDRRQTANSQTFKLEA